jgi:hypothetical protein
MPSITIPSPILTPRMQIAAAVISALISRNDRADLGRSARTKLVEDTVEITDLLMRKLEGGKI